MEGKDQKQRAVFAALIAMAVLTVSVVGFRWIQRVRQRTDLISAAAKASTGLEARFADSPLRLAADLADADGRYTAEAVLSQETALLGPVVCDVTIQADTAGHRFTAKGTARIGGRELGLEIYGDAEVLAVSADGSARGRYYGIEYDTFSEDIRQIPLLDLVVSEERIGEWDAALQALRADTEGTYRLPPFPETDSEALRRLLAEIAAAPCETEGCTLMVEGTTVTCQKRTYQTHGGQTFGAVTGDLVPEDETVLAALYLYRKDLVKAELSCGDIRYTLDLGTSPATGPLSISKEQTSDGTARRTTVSLSTERQTKGYTDTWTIRQTKGGSSEERTYTYSWEPGSGALKLQRDGSGQGIGAQLSRAENGLNVASDDLLAFLRLIGGDESGSPHPKIAGELVLRAGSEIAAPEYKKVSEWSLEDFYALILGAGPLFGIGLE